MLAEERFQKILELVKEQKSVTVQELTERLHISESTVRRDLTVLHDRGALRKVHGGATAVDMEYAAKDESVTVRQNLNQEEKTRIGKYAASLVEPGDFVYLDAGTTTEAMVEYMTCREAVYVTNGILHAAKLAQKGCRVLVPGGEVKESTLALVGPRWSGTWKNIILQKDFSEQTEWTACGGLPPRNRRRRWGRKQRCSGAGEPTSWQIPPNSVRPRPSHSAGRRMRSY